MNRHVREIKKEAEFLVAEGEIEDFRLDHDKKHHLISFQLHGDWHSVPFCSSPRTPYGNNFARQQIRRKIRGIELGHSQQDHGRLRQSDRSFG